jgi:raffinose/stachyose/melibiose transport system permease protein
MLVPLYLLVVNSLKPQQDIVDSPFSPKHTSLTYLKQAVTSPDYNVVSAYGLTSLLVVLVVAGMIVLGGPVAYLMARSSLLRYRLLQAGFLSAIFVPPGILLVPIVYVLRNLGLYGSLTGLVLVDLANSFPFAVFLFSGYIRSIPTSLDEAATIDGSTTLRTFWRVIFPLMKPAVTTAALLTALWTWNDFINPSILLGPTSDKYTVTTGIYTAVGQYLTNYTVVYPNILLTVAPVLVLFIVAQRFIVSGLMEGMSK